MSDNNEELKPHIVTLLNDLGLSKKYNVISDKEFNAIISIMETNEKISKLYESERSMWAQRVEECINHIKKKIELIKPTDIMEAQSYALSYRQMLLEEISLNVSKRTKVYSRIETIKHNKMIYYTNEYSAKVTNSEKLVMIEGHLSQFNRRITLIDSHISYLHDSVKTLDSLLYGVKNVIELLNMQIGR